MQPWMNFTLAMIAGLCTTGSFVPQVTKAWRERDMSAVSKRMYYASLVGFALWLGYGFLIHNAPIILFNVANIALSSIILVLKLKAEKAENLKTTPLR